MPRYRVAMMATVTTTVTVTANDKESALDAAYKASIPGLMFLDHNYPDVSEWEPTTEGFTIPSESIDDCVAEAD